MLIDFSSCGHFLFGDHIHFGFHVQSLFPLTSPIPWISFSFCHNTPIQFCVVLQQCTRNAVLYPIFWHTQRTEGWKWINYFVRLTVKKKERNVCGILFAFLCWLCINSLISVWNYGVPTPVNSAPDPTPSPGTAHARRKKWSNLL